MLLHKPILFLWGLAEAVKTPSNDTASCNKLHALSLLILPSSSCMLTILIVLIILIQNQIGNIILCIDVVFIVCCCWLLYLQVQREHHLPAGDFPDVNRFKSILSAFDFAAFPKMSKSMVKQIDDVLSIDIPNLVRAFDNPYQ